MTSEYLKTKEENIKKNIEKSTTDLQELWSAWSEKKITKEDLRPKILNCLGKLRKLNRQAISYSVDEIDTETIDSLLTSTKEKIDELCPPFTTPAPNYRSNNYKFSRAAQEKAEEIVIPKYYQW